MGFKESIKQRLHQPVKDWNRSGFYTQMVFVLVCYAWWNLEETPPGLAIGALGAAAVVITLRTTIQRREKVVWALIAMVLFVAESRSIFRDRSENDRKQRDFFDGQKAGFETIASQANRNFNVTTGALTKAIEGLNGVLINTQNIAKVTTENLLDVSGGDSFGYVIPGTAVKGSPITLILHGEGDNQLSSVHVRVMSLTRPCEEWGKSTNCREGFLDMSTAPFDMGSLAAHNSMRVPTIFPTVNQSDGTGEYRIEIRAPNGTAFEHIWFRPSASASGSAYRMQVERTVTGRHKEGDYKVGSQFMRMLKIRDWTDIPEIPKQQ